MSHTGTPREKWYHTIVTYVFSIVMSPRKREIIFSHVSQDLNCCVCGVSERRILNDVLIYEICSYLVCSISLRCFFLDLKTRKFNAELLFSRRWIISDQSGGDWVLFFQWDIFTHYTMGPCCSWQSIKKYKTVPQPKWKIGRSEHNNTKNFHCFWPAAGWRLVE